MSVFVKARGAEECAAADDDDEGHEGGSYGGKVATSGILSGGGVTIHEAASGRGRACLRDCRHAALASGYPAAAFAAQ